jgi:hypothetical protein
MEYVEGLPLADLIPEGGMPLEQVARYAGQIAGALAFAHEHGTIHGDLKGSNIIVTPEGNIKLLDFGLARRIPRSGMAEVTSSCLPLAEGGATAGTLPYLAPEVLRGHPTSRQSDVWALGVLLYQMATGELPFRGSTPFEVSMEIMMGAPPRLGQLPEPLQSALRRALEKDPQVRTAQAGELSFGLGENSLTAVARAGRDNTHEAATAAAAPVAPAASHRRIVWAAGAAMAFCVLVLGSVYARHVWVTRHAAQPIFASKVIKPGGGENPGVKVWVNTDSGTYQCPGTRWYGKTQEGEYMTQKQARDKGYHPAANRACI